MPKELQRVMAVEQEAIRDAKAKIAAAEGELKASHALKNASDVMSMNPISFQLRYLQTLNVIASQQNHTIIFPFPVDLLKQLTNCFKNGSSTQQNQASQD